MNRHFVRSPKPSRWSRFSRTVAMLLLLTCVLTSPSMSQDDQQPESSQATANWIWIDQHQENRVPKTACYFRRSFQVGAVRKSEIKIEADDHYVLYVNGRKIAARSGQPQPVNYDITSYLVRGNNSIAVKVTNRLGKSAGLKAAIKVTTSGGDVRDYSTDKSWKTSLSVLPYWQAQRFDDRQWSQAVVLSRELQLFVKPKKTDVVSTLPSDRKATKTAPLKTLTVKTEAVATQRAAPLTERFHTPPNFEVQQVAFGKSTGSLLAMTFNHKGQLLASRENGPILLITKYAKNGLAETVKVFCKTVTGCQGLLAHGNEVFAVGKGPAGPGLYRLVDNDDDGQADQVNRLLKFDSEMGEHGPHGIVFGPDGLLYLVLGNHTKHAIKIEPSSPYRHHVEGDLISPRYEDPRGHAIGVKAPGGTIIRTDTKGSFVEMFAGGLRNPYDISFDRSGELFTHDADMEWDRGAPWYRPTRVNHVIPGAEFGWRSGWAKWPNYYFDSLPETINTGPGSPTGMVHYDHIMFPRSLHNALFLCDWTRGRIMVIRSTPSGASVAARGEVFVEGEPLNVTDTEVGPDGWLYFSTGGRGTEGGIYRVVWKGKVPQSATQLGSGIVAALRQPHPNSAWGQAQIVKIKNKLGSEWETKLIEVVRNIKLRSLYRLRALDLMQRIGPRPEKEMLVDLTVDANALLRAKATYLLGLHGDESTVDALVRLIEDPNITVQRRALEALVRSGVEPPLASLAKPLMSHDRHLAWAARAALERIPVEKWERSVLGAQNIRIFLQGSLSLLELKPNRQTATAVLIRLSQIYQQGISKEQLGDSLRLVQRALLAGGLKGTDVPEFRKLLVQKFPLKSHYDNRELVRLLVYLQAGSAAEAMINHMKSDIPDRDKLHIVMHLARLNVHWDLKQKEIILHYYEQAGELPGGKSLGRYVEKATRDFCNHLTQKEQIEVLRNGAKWPNAALSVLTKLKYPLEESVLALIKNLDSQLPRNKRGTVGRLRIGIVAVLAQNGDEASMAYLRQLYIDEPDRRMTLGVALAQKPSAESFPMLVDSLSLLEGRAARVVLSKLTEIATGPEKNPEAYRKVILQGLRLKSEGNEFALAVLEHWTGKKLGTETDSAEAKLAMWQAWFAESYPEHAAVKLPAKLAGSKWTHSQLWNFIDGDEGSQGDPHRGAIVFAKAQCIKCHRHGDQGESIGPDLTTLGRRFHKKEILESILYPSQVISDQYSSTNIRTIDGEVITGLAVPTASGDVAILLSTGEKVTIGGDEIELSQRSNLSSMPQGLLNGLSLEEIADLFAFLRPPAKTTISRKKEPNRSQPSRRQ